MTQKTILSCWLDEDTIIRTDGQLNTSIFSQNVVNKKIDHSAIDLNEITTITSDPLRNPHVYTYDVKGILKAWNFNVTSVAPVMIKSWSIKDKIQSLRVGKSLIALLFMDGTTQIVKN